MMRTKKTRPSVSQAIRRAFTVSCLALLLAPAAFDQGLPGQNSYPPPGAQPLPRQQQPPQPPRPQGYRPPANPYVTQPRALEPRGHLAQWMHAHSNLPLDQQQRALDAEPGFRQLQPEVQQRMHDRLTQLNTMSPEQRQRTFSRTEWMEHLSQPQRMQVRSALTDLGALPRDRRMAVARTFHSLEAVPPEQRVAYLNSPQAHAEFSGQERGVLSNLLAAGPYLPPRP